MVADPTGAAVGLWQDKGFAGSQRANEHGTNIWNELVTHDVGQATPFYDQVLGLKAEALDMDGSPEPYTVFNVDGRAVAGTTAPQAAGIPAHWNINFNVDDADAAVARSQELGGTAIAEPFDVPGIGRLAVLQDPQGALVHADAEPAGGLITPDHPVRLSRS